MKDTNYGNTNYMNTEKKGGSLKARIAHEDMEADGEEVEMSLDHEMMGMMKSLDEDQKESILMVMRQMTRGTVK